MTHEAGREMDRLVAEQVFNKTIDRFRVPGFADNYDVYEVDEILDAASQTPDAMVGVREDGTPIWFRGARTLPSYSTNIAAAWLIVERIGGYFLLQHMRRTGPLGFTPLTWFCAFAAPRRFEAEAGTAPLAICLAALAFRAAEKEDLRGTPEA